MSEKQAKTEKNPDIEPGETEDRVRLKPFLGMRPGIYLAVIYSAALLLILFLALVYPGLSRPGSMVVLKTEPAGAALRVDGVYMGTSPGSVFVPQGKHSLELTLPGFTPERIDCEIPGRLFASVLFPRRYPLEAVLHAPDPAAVAALAAADFAEWTFGGEPTISWQAPLSLSEGVYRAAADGGGAIADIVQAAARFAVTRAALRDLIRAQTLAGNAGVAPSPLGLTRSIAGVTGFLSSNPGAAAWLADTLPPESTALLIASPWYQKQLAASADIASGESLPPPGGEAPMRQLPLDGLMFTGIGGGTLAQSEPFPHLVPIKPFMLSNTPVPAPVYADFLEENPQWKADQREALTGQGLVSGDYLAGDREPASGIGSVSWYAAMAFCEWLSGKLPSSLERYEVRLPTEAEWEYAAKSAARWGAVAGGITALPGAGWEWCADPWAPLPFIEAAPAAVKAVGSPERSVRGASPLNVSVATNLETRASLPPETCSPFVSFRPVIVEKGE